MGSCGSPGSEGSVQTMNRILGILGCDLAFAGLLLNLGIGSESPKRWSLGVRRLTLFLKMLLSTDRVWGRFDTFPKASDQALLRTLYIFATSVSPSACLMR